MDEVRETGPPNKPVDIHVDETRSQGRSDYELKGKAGSQPIVLTVAK